MTRKLPKEIYEKGNNYGNGSYDLKVTKWGIQSSYIL